MTYALVAVWSACIGSIITSRYINHTIKKNLR